MEEAEKTMTKEYDKQGSLNFWNPCFFIVTKEKGIENVKKVPINWNKIHQTSR
jgi:hypothetical protein